MKNIEEYLVDNGIPELYVGLALATLISALKKELKK